jgi:hypothetical protein
MIGKTTKRDTYFFFTIFLCGLIFLNLFLWDLLTGEISPREYQRLEQLQTKYPQIVPLVRKFLEDGKITRPEYNEIRDIRYVEISKGNQDERDE